MGRCVFLTTLNNTHCDYCRCAHCDVDAEICCAALILLNELNQNMDCGVTYLSQYVHSTPKQSLEQSMCIGSYREAYPSIRHMSTRTKTQRLLYGNNINHVHSISLQCNLETTKSKKLTTNK